MSFNAKEQKEKVVQWIRDWFEKNGTGCNAFIGVSGGKDSTVAAALCVEALGKERVFGVQMPDGEQADIKDSNAVFEHLGIERLYCNIAEAKAKIISQVRLNDYCPTEQAEINLPPRLRMAMLYCLSQSWNGRVANTCNLSEDYVGYSTKYGDTAGDFAPLKDFTSDEVIAIGEELGLPKHLLYKAPSDGLCGKTDEDNLGFTYAVLNKYIRTGKIDDPKIKEKIDHLHKVNAFKERLIERYEYKPF